VVFSLVIPNNWHTSWTTFANMLVPRSDNSVSGTPNMGSISSTSSWAILIDFGSDVGYTRGHLVGKSCTTMAYLLPLVTPWHQSLKGLLTGIGCKNGFCFLPTPIAIAHSAQFSHYVIASVCILSHHTCNTNHSIIFYPRSVLPYIHYDNHKASTFVNDMVPQIVFCSRVYHLISQGSCRSR